MKEEENKYYRPSKYEYKIGLRLEIRTAFGEDETKDEWTKYIVTCSSLGYNTISLWNMNCINEPRVKYLDRSDIEKIGFKYKRGSNSVNWFENNDTVIELNIHSYRVKITHCESLLFNGKIKNYSELEHVLDMIGVEYNEYADI